MFRLRPPNTSLLDVPALPVVLFAAELFAVIPDKKNGGV